MQSPYKRHTRILVANWWFSALLVVNVGLAAGVPAVAQTPIAVSESSALTPIVAPSAPEDVAAVRADIEARLEALPEVEAGEDVDSSGLRLAEATKAVRASLVAYRGQLDALVESSNRVAQLGSDEEIARRNKLIEEYRARIDELERAPSPADGEIAKIREEVAAEYEQINALHDATNQQQTTRATRLAELPKRAENVAEELVQARIALNEAMQTSPVLPEGMDEATFDRIRNLRLRELAQRVSSSALRAEQLATEKVVLELEHAAAESMLPVLQRYARVAGDRRSRLDALAARSESETIADSLEQADSPQARAYWNYRDLIAETRRGFIARIDGIRSRFRESERQRLVRRIDRHVSFYERLGERLDRVDDAEKNAAYRGLEDLVAKHRDEATLIADRLFESRREKDQLSAGWDVAVDELLEAQGALGHAVEGLAGEERAEYERLVAELAAAYRPALDETVTEVVSAQSELIMRLEGTETALAEFLETLSGHQESLFWSFTFARGPNVVQRVGFGVREAGSEGFGEESRAALGRVKEVVSKIPTGRYGLVGGLAVGGLVCGLLGRWRLRKVAHVHELWVHEELREKGGTEVGASDRFSIQTSRMLGAALPLALPAALLLGGVVLGDDLVGDMRLLAIRMLSLVLGLTVGWVLLTHLFHSGKPRFRMIPCSNVVAQYYRRWGRALWLISFVLTPPVVLLQTLGVGEKVVEALWVVYCTAMLLSLLVFARNRQTVVRIVGRAFATRRPAMFKLVVRVYLLVALGLCGLLVLEVMGYATFVDFVVTNVLHTAAILVVALLLDDLTADLARKYATTTEKAPEGEAGAVSEAGAADLDGMFEDFEAQEVGLMVGAGATLFRWALWLSALGWIAATWGMTQMTAKQVLAYPLAQTDGGPVTVQRFLAAILALYLAVKVSRGVRAALDQKVYPAYTTINRAAQATINSLLHYTLLVVGVYVALQLVHVNLGAIAVLLGGLGLGLGLGLQPLVVNFVSGLLIFAERHIKVGDLVEVDGELGEVVGISMRSTQIKSYDNIDRIIPNGEFMTATVTNWTLRDTRIRGKINIGVAYGSDPEMVRDVLVEIARDEPLVHVAPEPAVWFVNFGDNSLDFVLACWFSSPGDRWGGMINMRYAIDKRFKERGIEIPFPQRTLSLHPDAELPVRLVGTGERATKGGEHRSAQDPSSE